MIHSPFASWVAFGAAAFGEATEADLAPIEAASISPRAVAKRRAEFVAGRLAARRALGAAGFEPAPPVAPGPDRAPVWPAGMVGTITHTHSMALAAVAHGSKCGGLGMDLEHDANLRRMDVARQICDGTEREWVGDDRHRLLALFSAKESIFKALYPRVGRYFGFGAVTCRWDEGAFAVELLEDLGPHYPVGSQLSVPATWHGDYVLTCLQLPPDDWSRVLAEPKP